ncbi:MAG: tripartite tricarboxylate transporter permease, partial [Candidatus Nanoarchaeia archaeon]|nr:tripartite tricarboxylate transporter permease [Candidatus Nanoarchaeia archaeon]
KQPLLALLTGLFGLSSVISNISKKVDFPKQMKNVAVDIKRSEVVKSLFSGVLASVILGFVPGLGPSQASYISTSISKNKTPKNYLVSLGAVNTADIFMSILALNLIGKPRLGAFAVISNLFSDINMNIMLISCISAGVISFFMVNKLSPVFISFFEKIDFRKLNIYLLIFLPVLIFIIDGLTGLIVLFTASCVGLITEKLNVSRTHLMGVLILPILFY